MKDELVSALIPGFGLRAVLVTTTALARRGAELHHARPAAAALFAQGLTSALLLASLQKEKSRVNLQLECGGPARGFFCDAGTDGTVRGYIKNPHWDVEGEEGPFHWRPALGNSGFLSVLRDQGQGEFYRSSVELTEFDVAKDFERYFLTSEQVASAVVLAVLPEGAERLGHVAGLLLQTLPDGDAEQLQRIRARLDAGGFAQALRLQPKSAAAFLTALLAPEGEPEWMARYGLEFKCSCSRERVQRALLALGREELADLISKEGRSEVTCEFCTTQYVVEREELTALLQGISPA